MAVPSDPLYAQQWHLPLIGNIQKIWDDYTGTGVQVVVYDDGVEFGHADLAANYDASQHFTYQGVTYAPTPLSGSDAHGTACAGLIAAVDNNGRGGTGVAHGATLTGLDYLNTLQLNYDWDTQTSSPIYDAMMQWAANFDIMSNSWGMTPTYDDAYNLNIAGNASAVNAAHFAWVSANGRGGLGTIVVKAAGNDTMNANGEGMNVSRHTITVSATQQNGFLTDYSNFGSSILLTAPAAAVTTDRSGENGYNWAGSTDGDALVHTDYTSTFGGTSAATPVVSGVVALMLDANDRLGWRDVQMILAQSAGHTGSAVGAAASGFEVAGWQVMGASQWNGGGAIYNLSYGFGMVDAFAAVRMAEVWTRMNGAADTSANEVHLARSYTGSPFAIADSDGNTTTTEGRINLGVGQDILIDSVQVTIDMSHSYSSDLAIYLRSPTGQLMQLVNHEGGSNPIDMVWTFAAEGFRGMSSLGTWSIMFHDDASGDTGTVYGARLDFYGSRNTVNDVHTFTDDFQMLRTLDASRRVIVDSNGGTDWLNFAAMSGNLSVNMAITGEIRVNGTLLANIGGTAPSLELLQAGDGADVLLGNTLANRIYGGRGHDSIAGGAGNDLLMGEAGNDTLVGGGGEDAFVFTRGAGLDRIADFTDNVDTLRLDDAIWGGGRTVAQVLSSYGSLVAGSAVLTFSAAQVITLAGVTSLSSLSDDITII